MFCTILEEADEETASRMVPVILERVGLLYPVQNYQKEIHEYVTFISIKRVLLIRRSSCDLFPKCNAANIEITEVSLLILEREC